MFSSQLTEVLSTGQHHPKPSYVGTFGFVEVFLGLQKKWPGRSMHSGIVVEIASSKNCALVSNGKQHTIK